MPIYFYQLNDWQNYRKFIPWQKFPTGRYQCREKVAHVHVYVIVIGSFTKIVITQVPKGMYLYKGGVASFLGFSHLSASDRNLGRALQHWAHDRSLNKAW